MSVQVRSDSLSPSVIFGQTIAFNCLVSRHGISPGLGSSSVFIGSGGKISVGIAVVSISNFDASSTSSDYEVLSGGLPEVTEILLDEGVASVGSGSEDISSWEMTSWGFIALSFSHGVADSGSTSTSSVGVITCLWSIVDAGRSEGFNRGHGGHVDLASDSVCTGCGSGISSSVTFIRFNASRKMIPVEFWCGNSSSVLSFSTKWVGSLEVSGPLSVGLAFKSGPDLALSKFNCSVVTIWASVDWSSRGKNLVEVGVVPAGFEEKDDDHDVENGESNKAETEHLSSSESGDETSVDGRAAGEGDSGVGVDGNSHTNVTGKDGGH